jgi:hypothetical protein
VERENKKKTIKISRQALLAKEYKQTTVKKEGKEPERIDKETLLALIRAMKQQ